MPVTIPIDDPDDPRIAPFRDIRERTLVRRQGRFIIEGEVVLRLALRRSRFAIESLLLEQRRVEGLAEDCARLPEDTPIHVASQEVMDRIAGFPIHRGILALGRRGPEPGLDAVLAALPARALVVVLIGLTNHDNVGGIFRNAAAFGADLVVLDRSCCDPLYRKAIRVSVGAALTVPFVRAGAASELLASLADAGFEARALSPSGARELGAEVRPQRLALVLGTEGPGLPAGLLDALPSVRIPMHGDFDSVNVAVASGIALYAYTRGTLASQG